MKVGLCINAKLVFKTVTLGVKKFKLRNCIVRLVSKSAKKQRR